MLIGQFNQPGMSAVQESKTFELLWGGDASKIMLLQLPAQIDGTARDAGNTITHVLRPGLILGQVTATGKFKQYDAAASDGTETAKAVLGHELVMVDPITQANVDRLVPIIAVGPLKVSELLIKGAAFVGHTNEAAVRTAFSGRIWFDDLL